MKRLAVIDLGTNTFHLLIAAFDEDGQLVVSQRERVFVKLAEDGIGIIKPMAFQRGIDALLLFKKTLSLHPPDRLKVFGTAALRTAKNGQEFIDKIFELTGITIDLISGAEEARLIYMGVKQVVDFNAQHQLIMDIGGGSVEFIIANNEGVKWSQSFPIGVAVLYHHFHKSEPISPTETAQLIKHLAAVLPPLTKALSQFPVNKLIGASGTFDVLEDKIVKQREHPHRSSITVENYLPIHHQIIQLDQIERLMLDDLPASRADMIVVALLLIKQVIDFAQIDEIVISSYAMKEGMLYELGD